MGIPLIIAAIGLMLLGGNAIGLGAKGYGVGGLPFGGGLRLHGRPARVVGAILIWLGMMIFGAAAACLLSLG